MCYGLWGLIRSLTERFENNVQDLERSIFDFVILVFFKLILVVMLAFVFR